MTQTTLERSLAQVSPTGGPTDIGSLISRDPLTAYSRRWLSREDALRALGLRDYASLLVALGDANLPMPMPPREEIQAEAATFVELWSRT